MDVRRPSTGAGGRAQVFRLGGARTRAVAVVAVLVTGFAGAAVVDSWALPGPDVEFVADYGPAGDGLVRLVVSSAAGALSDEQLATIGAQPGVVSAQRLFDGSALVAGAELEQDALAAALPGTDVHPSVSASFDTASVSDPFWSQYGYHLANNGANAYNQSATVGADVDAPTAWKVGTGRGLVVAVTDSGMYSAHADFAGALWTNSDEICGSTVDNDHNGLPGDCHGWNFYRGNSDTVNDGGNSHGTHVAGIIGARANNGEGLAGVAPDVTIMPLAVGYGSSVDVSAAAAAIRYAVDNGADVINASWGGTGTAPTILTQAVDYADAHGVMLVAAAGNSTADIDASPTFPASMTQANVLTVGSSDAADRMSSFSNYGAVGVDLFAPGTGIVAPGTSPGSYVAMSGTSMAAPVVAAAVALYRGRYPNATLAELRQQLLADTTPRAAFAGRSVSGGRLSLTNLGNSASALSYGFTSMTAAPGPVAPQIVATGTTPAGSYSVHLGLGMEYQNEVMALSGQSLTMNGTTVATDDAGDAVFPLGTLAAAGSRVYAPTTTLAAGRYVLSVQTFLDDVPVGQRFAAPLVVQVPAATPTATPSGTATSSPAPTGTAAPTGPATSSAAGSSTSTPRTTSAAGTATSPSAGSSVAAPSAGGTSSPGSATTSAPGATPPGTSSPASSAAPSAGSSAGSSASSSAAAPTSAPAASTTATSTAPAGTTSPATSTAPAATTAPASSTAAAPTTAAPGTGTTSPGSDTRTYPAQGPWQLTSISPTTVSTDGNTSVAITGTAIPSGSIVRVGSSSSGRVLSESTTRLVFSTPAAVAGSYDVYVYGPDRITYSVLRGALTYVSPVGTGTPAPTTSSAPTSAPPDTGVSVPGGSAAPTSAAAPTTPAQTVFTGPQGQRLVRSATLARTAPAIWRQSCATACSGVLVAP